MRQRPTHRVSNGAHRSATRAMTFDWTGMQQLRPPRHGPSRLHGPMRRAPTSARLPATVHLDSMALCGNPDQPPPPRHGPPRADGMGKPWPMPASPPRSTSTPWPLMRQAPTNPRLLATVRLDLATVRLDLATVRLDLATVRLERTVWASPDQRPPRSCAWPRAPFPFRRASPRSILRGRAASARNGQSSGNRLSWGGTPSGAPAARRRGTRGFPC
jgi:hypothetical protein